MILRTEIRPEKFDFEINYSSNVLTLGSCFSDVMGSFLELNKFKVCSNPFGTVYNLSSISDLLFSSLDLKNFNEEWVLERDEVYFHHNYHSDIFDFSREGLKAKINEIGKTVKGFIQQADLMVITLGTSWVYEKENSVVSNCHKVPASQFSKRLLSFDEQKDVLRRLIPVIQNVNPEIKIVFTVSPVRHLKDGLVENSISKSILRLICDFAVKEFDNVYYFPSYEIMMDDLRDYRFYKQDLIHPTEMAEKHIADLFLKSVFSEDTTRIISEWSKIRMALNHRPFNPKSQAHRSFLVTLQKKIREFEQFFSVEEELGKVSSQLERT